MLVDTGMGAPRRMFHDAGHLLESLAAIGVQPGDLTDVIFTHLHFDHVGWASRDGEIVFPNATFRCDVRDLEHFMGKNEEVTEIMTPVAERMETGIGRAPFFQALTLWWPPATHPAAPSW